MPIALLDPFLLHPNSSTGRAIPPDATSQDIIIAKINEIIGVESPSVDAMMIPAGTLFVSPSWPAEANPAVFFTTIAAALAQAALMNPSTTNKIAVLIFPGAYVVAGLALVSNVNLIGAERDACRISGTMTWNPGVGVNAPQIGTAESIELTNLLMSTAGTTLTVDTTGKPVSTLQTGIHLITMALSNFSCTSGPTQKIEIFIFNCNIGANSGAWSLTNVTNTIGPNFIFNTRLRNLVLRGNTSLTIAGCQCDFEPTAGSHPIQIFDTSVLTITGSHILNRDGITVGTGLDTPILRAAGCWIDPTVAITTKLGAISDLRGSAFPVTSLSGAGAYILDRMNGTFGPTVPGANAVTLPFPLPAGDTSYNVLPVQTNTNLLVTPVAITGKTNTGFSLFDPTVAAGNTFDFTVIHEQ